MKGGLAGGLHQPMKLPSTLNDRFGYAGKDQIAVLIDGLDSHFGKAVLLITRDKIGDRRLAGQNVAREHGLEPLHLGRLARQELIAEEIHLQVIRPDRHKAQNASILSLSMVTGAMSVVMPNDKSLKYIWSPKCYIICHHNNKSPMTFAITVAFIIGLLRLAIDYGFDCRYAAIASTIFLCHRSG